MMTDDSGVESKNNASLCHRRCLKQYRRMVKFKLGWMLSFFLNLPDKDGGECGNNHKCYGD